MLAIWNKKVEKAVELWDEVYEYNCVGGGLHVVLDDHNLSNDTIQWCIDESIGKNGLNDVEENRPGQIEAETECAKHLLTMTMAEKLSAQAYQDTARYGIMKREDGTVHMRQDLLDCYAADLVTEGVVKIACVCPECYERPDSCECLPERIDPEAIAQREEDRKKGFVHLTQAARLAESRIINDTPEGEKELASRQRRCDGCGEWYAKCKCALRDYDRRG